MCWEYEFSDETSCRDFRCTGGIDCLPALYVFSKAPQAQISRHWAVPDWIRSADQYGWYPWVNLAIPAVLLIDFCGGSSRTPRRTGCEISHAAAHRAFRTQMALGVYRGLQPHVSDAALLSATDAVRTPAHGLM